MQAITGSCLCGKITYEVNPRFRVLYFCHCSKCRNVTGSSNASFLLTKKANLQWMSGEERLQSFTTPSGYYVVYCPDCGSPMPKDRWNKIYLIPAGSLSGEPKVETMMHVFCDSKATWHEITDEFEQHAEAAPR